MSELPAGNIQHTSTHDAVHVQTTSGRVPRLLDLCCGAGVSADGYAAAGFTITGVDKRPQPHYPYEFHRRDALDVLQDTEYINGFDLIHASPPCQAFTQARYLTHNVRDPLSATLLTEILQILRSPGYPGTPYVVENVPSAPGMQRAVTLCGQHFNLAVRRHRLFLANWPLPAPPPCHHSPRDPPATGVYYRLNSLQPSGVRTAPDLPTALAAMQTQRTVPYAYLKEGVPPAYTRYVSLAFHLWRAGLSPALLPAVIQSRVHPRRHRPEGGRSPLPRAPDPVRREDPPRSPPPAPGQRPLARYRGGRGG